MATRKIKDAKDLDTNELIYFKGHAQATFMSDGRTVEETINSSTGGGSYAGNYPFINKYIYGSDSFTIEPNTYYRISTVVNVEQSELNIELGESVAGIANEYVMELWVDSNWTISFSDYIEWQNNEPPVFEADFVYVISIVNNLACYAKFNSF